MLDCVPKNKIFIKTAIWLKTFVICLSLCLYISIIEVCAYYSLVFQVERWWGNLLPKFVPLLYDNGGPIIMVQVCCYLLNWLILFD